MEWQKRKRIIVILIIILCLYNSSNFVFAQKQKVQEQTQQKTNISQSFKSSRIQELLKNKNWREVSRFWKEFNHFEGLEQKSIPRKPFVKFEKKLPFIQYNLEALVKEHLLTNKEKDFIYAVFQDRLARYEHDNNLAMCRRVIMPMMGGTNKKYDLEKRYDLLEKLFKEGKLNSETFKSMQKQIVDDMNAMKPNDWYLFDKDINKSNVSLIMYLNK